MNKTQLTEKISENAEISKVKAGHALDAIMAAIKDALVEGDSVALVGFGTFSLRERAARSGRNPQTGEIIQIEKAKIPAFKAGKGLKDAVNA